MLGLLLAIGCKTESSATERTGETANVDPTESAEARRLTHRRAFEALIPLATEAMKLADPVSAAAIGLGSPRPVPSTASEREALRAALDPAILEAKDIDAMLLEPKQQIGLRTIRFVLDRANDQLLRRWPARIDPTVTPGALGELLTELEYRAFSGDCGECAAALDAMVPALTALPKELTASSAAGIEGAIEDLGKLSDRLERFAARTASPDELRDHVADATAAMNATRAELSIAKAAIPSEPNHAWTDPPPARGASPTLRRLPDRLGPRALVRMLEVEEGLAVTPAALLDATKKNLARYQAMRAQFVADAPSSSKARAVDEARCREAWSRLEQTTLAQPGFEGTSLDCAAVTRYAAGEDHDDAALLTLVVDLGVIDPMRRAFRKDQDPTIALASGGWTPAAQRNLRRIMVLTPTGDKVALGRAIADGENALCATATALWIHGELGEDDKLTSWLADVCPAMTPEQWIASAEARPRSALTGLGLASVSEQPASMVGIDLFYWAPLGLVPILATPPDAAANQPSEAVDGAAEQPIRVEVQELDE